MAAESVSSAVCTHSKDSVHCQGRKIFLNYGRFVSCVLVQHPVWSYLLIENVVLEMEFWFSVAAERCKIWNFEMISKSKYLFYWKAQEHGRKDTVQGCTSLLKFGKHRGAFEVNKIPTLYNSHPVTFSCLQSLLCSAGICVKRMSCHIVILG